MPSTNAKTRCLTPLGRRLVLALALCAALWSPAPTDAAEDEQKAVSSGSGALQLGDRALALSFSLAPEGPLFALQPIAAGLGLELRTEPLGQGHTLVVADKEVIVGPGSSQIVITESADGTPRIESLRQAPIKLGAEMQVPLDFLERTIGQELGYRLQWNPETFVLRLDPRERREVEAVVTVVHQYQVSTVEIRFSEAPRYRAEELPGALRIRLLDDQLLPPTLMPSQSPLVREVEFGPDFLVLQLAAGAQAAPPRLLPSPPRLIIEVFEQPAAELPESESPRTEASSRRGLRTIVLDPGHGGSETGAIGNQGTAEKDLNLLIARSLERRLEGRLAVEVVLTRDSDVELPLESRTAIANQNKADLFISLHLNSSYGKRPHGTETYFLSREASDRLAAEAAATENQYAADDPQADLKLILWDLAQSYHLNSSQRFANLVQEELNLTLGLRNRGVKQAPFKVLMGAEMPAVLVELGFLSNPEEEAKLNNPAYRNELVASLVRAVVRFKTQLEAGQRPPGESEAADLSRERAGRP